MDMFVGHLPTTTTADDLRQLCEAYGVVARLPLLQEQATGQASGVGCVEMPDAAAAPIAMAALQGTRLGGQPLTIHQTRLGGVW